MIGLFCCVDVNWILVSKCSGAVKFDTGSISHQIKMGNAEVIRFKINKIKNASVLRFNHSCYVTFPKVLSVEIENDCFCATLFLKHFETLSRSALYH